MTEEMMKAIDRRYEEETKYDEWFFGESEED